MEKLKWACDEQTSMERDRAYGYSWPQRNYRCSFCKKEFKSAQALGGHMNIHRRDRARMRLSSPSSWDFPYPNPNPSPNPRPILSSNTNPSFSLPPSPPKLLHCNLGGGRLLSTCKTAAVAANLSISSVERNEKKGALVIKDLGMRKDARVWKSNKLVRLDLSLGFMEDVNEDLDLELRLGTF